MGPDCRVNAWSALASKILVVQPVWMESSEVVILNQNDIYEALYSSTFVADRIQ